MLGALVSIAAACGGAPVTGGTYEIVIRGTLSDAFVAALNGFTVKSVTAGLTCLTGHVTDQERLLGTLQILRNMTAEIVSVNPARN